MAKIDEDELDALLEGVQNQDNILTSWLESLPLGTHVVAVKEVRVKQSKKDESNRIEADFVIIESDNPEVHQGTAYGWMYPIDAKGFIGKYAKSRSQKLFQDIGVGVGDKREVKPLGRAIIKDGFGIGALVQARVTRVIDKDTGQVKTRVGDGTEIHNLDTFAIPGQSEEDVASMKMEISKISSKKTTTTSDAAPKKEPEDTVPPPPPVTKKFSGIKLGGK